MPEENLLTYRGYPVRRLGNLLYYGELNDRFVVMLQVMRSEQVMGLDVSRLVLVKLMNNDPDLQSRRRVEKKAEKDGLYSALDLAAIWLDRYLKA